MHLRKTIFIFTLSVWALFFSLLSLDALGVISVEPAKIRLSIPAGSTKAGSINIVNPTKDSKYIKAYLEDWYYLPGADGSKDFKPAGTTELSCANWISFVPAEFTLPAFSRQVINYTVRVPQDAVGGHYAILFLESPAPGKSSGEEVSVGIAIRVGCLFYIEPEGTIKRTAQLDNLSLVREANDSGLGIYLDFKNTGNVDLTVGGNFDIIDKKGLVFARGKFNDIYTFPGDGAKLIANWSQPLSKGKYDLILTFDLGRALEEVNMGRGPIMVKEAEIEIGEDGDIIKVGDLK